jgi:hypothetical protein
VGAIMEMTTENLLLKIEFFRKEMIKLGVSTGFNSPETIQLSQTLDKLILKYQKMLH